MAVCYICSSTKHVDDHHIDCQHGEISPDTVPLCRRCHRTYHNWGVEWFDDEVLDRAIEVENMRRRIFSEPPLEKGDIVRSDYWYKKHGIKKPKPVEDRRIELIKQGLEPLCGWEWIEEHKGKRYPQQGIEVLYDGEVCLALAQSSVKPGLIRAAMAMRQNEAARE